VRARAQEHGSREQRQQRRDDDDDGSRRDDQGGERSSKAGDKDAPPTVGAKPHDQRHRQEEHDSKRAEAHSGSLRRDRSITSLARRSAARACGTGTMNGVMAAATSVTTPVRNARRHAVADGGTG
jgi:hypothetical protein